ncbi:MAG: DUF1186 domain-containing protein [Bacteroidota bacterium]|jgi:hypothetical protein|nr:DUF1186 domain-containing protein [Bacteroidota bacterium]
MKTDELVLQFRIGLQEVEPEVWRRIQVPAWYSLWDLHVAIQDAMGWQDSHLHSFTLPDRFGEDVLFGIPLEDAGELEGDTQRTVAGWLYATDRVFDAPGVRADYLYDFGDSWLHDVTFEGLVPADDDADYPRCIDGAQPCPPEDIGGAGGYANLLDILADPEHEEAADYADWLRGEVTRYAPFVPHHFDLADITFDDPDERWRVAFSDTEEALPEGPPRSENRRPPAFPLPGSPEDELITIFDAINYNTGEYPRDEVEYIVRNADVCTPLLLMMLEEVVEDPDGILDDPEYMGHWFALMLLGHLRVSGTQAILAEIAIMPDALPSELFGDILTEFLPAVLHRTCAGVYDTIHAIARNAEADMWVRSSAVDAILYGVLAGDYAREDALRLFAELLDACGPDDDPFMASHLAASMVDLHPGEYVDRIRRAYEDGLIDPGYMQWKEVLVDAEKSIDDCLAGLRAGSMCRYIDDIHASIEWWACFHEDSDYTESDPAPVRSGAAFAKRGRAG